MALIDAGNPVTAEDQRKFWEDELKNKRTLSNALDKAIYALLHDEKKSYSMDTGQSTINVTVHDIPALMNQQEKTIKLIEYLEDKLGINQTPQMFQGIPSW